MKKMYETPKVVMVDFCYDEQVTASSSGGVALHGDPGGIGRCQQSSMTSCYVFWSVSDGQNCELNPFSIPGFPVV